MLYFDNAATTRPHPRVEDAMYAWKNFANASSAHEAGIEARKQISKARQSVAALLNCSEDQVLFTSGGSEANATVIRGLKSIYTSGHRGILYSAGEHESVKKNAELAHATAMFLDRPREIPLSSIGAVRMDRLISMLEDFGNIDLVSVMASNNEIPIINNVADIAEICHEYDALYHADCVQAVGSIDLDVNKLHCDFLSLSAHKFHGPKGVGVLYCKDKSKIYPLIAGGESQEYGMRGGTENVAGIIGLGVAVDVLMEHEDGIRRQIERVKKSFYDRIMECAHEKGLSRKISTNGSHTIKGTKIVSITLHGIDAQSMVFALSANGVCVSAGSACNSHSSEASDTLLAIGLSEEDAHSTIRVSFSPMNSITQAEKCAEIIIDTAEKMLNREEIS